MPTDTELSPAERETAVLEAIDLIRPALQSDGGDIVFQEVDADGVVHVKPRRRLRHLPGVHPDAQGRRRAHHHGPRARHHRRGRRRPRRARIAGRPDRPDASGPHGRPGHDRLPRRCSTRRAAVTAGRWPGCSPSSRTAATPPARRSPASPPSAARPAATVGITGAPGRGQEHPHRPSRGRAAGHRRPRRRARGRPEQPVLRRGDPRRPGPHVRPRHRPRRLRALHGHPRAPRRPGPQHAAGRAGARGRRASTGS